MTKSIVDRAIQYQKKAKSIGATSFQDWTDELAQAVIDFSEALETIKATMYVNNSFVAVRSMYECADNVLKKHGVKVGDVG